MKLGIGSYTYGWAVGVPGHLPDQPLSAIGLVELAGTLGIHVVQYCDNLPLDCLPDTDLDPLLERARELNVELEVGTRGATVSNVVRHLDLAKRVGAKFVRLVIDSDCDEPTVDDVITTLSPLMPAFTNADIRLAIENHDRFPTADLIRIIKALGVSHAGICLDTVNSFGSLEMVDKVVSDLAPYTVNVHVKDFQIRRIAGSMGFEVVGCPAGSGRLDIPWLLNEVQKSAGDVNFIIELWTPYGETLASTIDTERKWAEESVSYMRQLIVN